MPAIQGWTYCSKLQTFLAEIKLLKSPEEVKKAREGEKAGYDLELPFISLDRETPKHGRALRD